MRIIPCRPVRRSCSTGSITRNIVGDNNIVQHVGAVLNEVSFNIQGHNNIIIIHPNAYLNNVSFNLYGNNHRIIIGQNCRFNERGSIWAEDHDCFISIGKDTTFEGVHLSATEPGSKLIIGEDCMFSYDIDVRTGDSHSILSKSTGQRMNYAKNVIFGNHVWVASHCIFTKGTQVNNGSIVGTGSLVNTAFELEHVLIAGRPARVLNHDVEWLRERVYQAQSVTSLNDKAEPRSVDNISELSFKVG